MASQLGMDDLFGDSISVPNEPHLACVLLLDVSGSMDGDSINSLNNAIAMFKEQVCKDEIAKKRVDISIITFSDSAEIVQDFVPVGAMSTVRLSAGGRTNMADGINVAIDKLKERNHLYNRMGVPCFKPWIFMITDGYSTSEDYMMDMVANRIAEEENKGSVGKLKFWAIGVDNYSKKELFKLTKRVVELKEHNFTGIFDWLSDSMTAISNSTVSENVMLDDLPEDARKARMDRRIDEDW